MTTMKSSNLYVSFHDNPKRILKPKWALKKKPASVASHRGLDISL
jgi:hypothetical protein